MLGREGQNNDSPAEEVGPEKTPEDQVEVIRTAGSMRLGETMIPQPMDGIGRTSSQVPYRNAIVELAWTGIFSAMVVSLGVFKVIVERSCGLDNCLGTP